MRTQVNMTGGSRSASSSRSRLTIIGLAVALLCVPQAVEPWPGSIITIDPYPPIAPRWIPDITDPGDSIGLQADQIIDVLILSEGYLAAESARFVGHVQRWYDTTFGSATAIGIRPYTTFKQAFRVRAVWDTSGANASAARDSYYRVKIDPSDTNVSLDGWWDGDSGANKAFRDSVFKKIDSLPTPKDTTRYPSSLDNQVYGHDIIPSMADVYSNLYVVLLIRAAGDKNPGGVAITVKKYGQPQRVKTALGKTEWHEFGHAFGYLKDEYIDSRGGVNTTRRNPAPEDRSVFNLCNLNFVPTLYDDSMDRCDDMLLWPHLAPGGQYNPSLYSLIGNMFAGGDWYYGVAHSEYKCLMNGTHDNYFCDRSGDAVNLRDWNNFCFWCEEVMAVRILERTHQLVRPADSADINARGRQWYRLWDDSLRDAYYSYFNVDSLIMRKDSCYDLSCPACSAGCAATYGSGLPACIAACEIRDVGHAVFVDGDNGDDADNGSSRTPKKTISNAVAATCDPQRLVVVKTASYPGALVVTDRAIIIAAGCSPVIIGK